MTNQLTEKQITWAKSHDWFSHMQGDCIVVVDSWVNVKTGERGNDEIVWTDTFKALRDFAGY